MRLPDPRDYTDPRQQQIAADLRRRQLLRTRRVRALTWLLNNWLLGILIAIVAAIVTDAFILH